MNKLDKEFILLKFTEEMQLWKMRWDSLIFILCYFSFLEKLEAPIEVVHVKELKKMENVDLNLFLWTHSEITLWKIRKHLS